MANIHLAEKKINQTYHYKVSRLAKTWAEDQGQAKLRILEIGVGRGNIPKLLRDSMPDQDITYVGADIDEASLKSLVDEKTLDDMILFTSDNLGDFLYDGEKFDLLVMCHVLEHIENPKQFLSDARKKFLVSGGTAVLAVPNSARPDCLVNSLIGRHYSNAGHYYSWDKSHWRRFIEDHCGLKNVEHYADGWALPIPRILRNIPGLGRSILAIETGLGRILPGWSFSSVTMVKSSRMD